MKSSYLHCLTRQGQQRASLIHPLFYLSYSRRDMYLLFLCEFSLQQANLDTTHSVLSQIQTAHKLSLNLNE